MISKKAFFLTVAGSLGALVLMWALLKPPAEGPVGLNEILPEGIPVEGPASSTVTIVEFLDFQCPSCAAFHPTMKRIREEYAGRIRFAQRQFPLVELHPDAKGAAIAAVCSDKQGKYFEYTDAMILNQASLERPDLIRYAEALKLDKTAFETCLDDQAVSDFVANERKIGESFGIRGTPWIFVNGESLSDTPTYNQLKQLVEEGLAGTN